MKWLNRLNRLFQSRNSPPQESATQDSTAAPPKQAIESVEVQALKEQGDNCLDNRNWHAAEEAYRRALSIDNSFAAVHNNLGLALMEQGRLDEAEQSIKQAIALNPKLFNSHYILGTIANQQDRQQEALEHFRNATTVKPDFAEAFNAIGNILAKTDDHEGAKDAFLKTIALNPDIAEALYGLAWIHLDQEQWLEGISYLRRTLEVEPTFTNCRLELLHYMQKTCSWQDIDTYTELIRRNVRETPVDPHTILSPFSFLALPGTTSAEQKTCAEKWTKNSYRTQIQLRKELNFRFDRAPNAKIRVGYLSADFHNHATAILMAQVFEFHDKSRFHISAYSYGPDDNSGIRRRLQRSFDEFIDIEKESALESAKRIYHDRIDILVDLKGYTSNTRSEILALRPAPIQVNYLGYPGSMGADFVDYLIADPVLVPSESSVNYSEKIAYLPDCYQPNDRTRPRPAAPGRASQQLPEQGIVFCCFNQSYKITPQVFDIWCRLLLAVPSSVLWLLSDTALTEKNLRHEAQQRGVDDKRLIFAQRVQQEQHLARLQCADLFLDTFTYNAHTTCSEALWMGLPVITCAGEALASRVAGSVLSALELPELVTTTEEDYFKLALTLATDDKKRFSIRDKIEANRLTTPLFDSQKLTKNLEHLYETMLEDKRKEATDFQIVIINPINYRHSQAFTEVAETIHYGLKSLGKTSGIIHNTFHPTARNIILGSGLLTMEDIALMPSNSIVYNLEQIYDGSPWLTPQLLAVFKQFEIWDYSQRNVDSIRSMVSNPSVFYVPIGYVPEMTRIPKQQEEDIDILFYGSMNEHRQKILAELAALGLRVEAVFGVYGQARNDLISRAKLVLNMRLYASDIFEIVRVSYLLANQKTVVSECDNTTDIEEDMREAVALAPYTKLVETCQQLLDDQEKRQALAKRGFELMAKRSEAEYLRLALNQDLPPSI